MPVKTPAKNAPKAPKRISETSLQSKLRNILEACYYAALADAEAPEDVLRDGNFYQSYDNLHADKDDKLYLPKGRIVIGAESKQVLMILVNSFVEQFCTVHLPAKNDVSSMAEAIAEMLPGDVVDVVFANYTDFEWEADADNTRLSDEKPNNDWLTTFINGQLEKSKTAGPVHRATASEVFVKFYKHLAFTCARLGHYQESISLNYGALCGILLTMGFSKATVDEIRDQVVVADRKPKEKKKKGAIEERDENEPALADSEVGDDAEDEGADAEDEGADAEDADAEGAEDEGADADADAEGADAEDADAEDADADADADAEDADAEDADAEDADAEDADADADAEDADAEDADAEDADADADADDADE